MSKDWFKYMYDLLFLTNLILLSFNNSESSNSNLGEIIAKINFAFICTFLIEDWMKLFCWRHEDSKIFLMLEFAIDSISFVIIY